MKHPHLGQLIEARLKEIGMSKAEFGRRMDNSRQNVTLIMKRGSFDTQFLSRVCEVLDYDFFAYLVRSAAASGESQRPDAERPVAFIQVPVYAKDADTLKGLLQKFDE